jgi:hypothetical protein
MDDAEPDQDRDGDHDELGDLEPVLLLVAARDQPAGERRSGCQPGELHAATARG